MASKGHRHKWLKFTGRMSTSFKCKSCNKRKDVQI